MEVGTISMPHDGSSTTSSGSPESLNGQIFGQKFYFEELVNVPNEATCKSTSSNSNTNTDNGITAKKGPMPRCQVEGCNIDLSDVKTYYSRHKVCGIHSKSPMVIVSGLEQRFCQQCSRFHQLHEFDQGKRSCRRRLAGHNERRRKPPPGSLLSSRLGRLSSSFFGDSAGRCGGFLLHFSSYPSNPEQEPGNQSTSAGRYLHDIWPGNFEDPPQSKMFHPGSAGGSSYSIPLGECITGVSSDSTCALSLLSNQTWSSKNSASSNQLGHLNPDGAPMSRCTRAHVSLPGNNNGSSWVFKDNEVNAGYQVTQPDHLGSGHMSQPVGDLVIENIHSGGRRYMEVDHSRTYNSNTSGNVHWSLF